MNWEAMVATVTAVADTVRLTCLITLALATATPVTVFSISRTEDIVATAVAVAVTDCSIKADPTAGPCP